MAASHHRQTPCRNPDAQRRPEHSRENIRNAVRAKLGVRVRQLHGAMPPAEVFHDARRDQNIDARNKRQRKCRGQHRQHILRLALEANGNNGAVGDFNWIQLTPTPLPAIPTNLKLTAASGTELDLSWANSDSFAATPPASSAVSAAANV